jgi:hypothetical protein
MKTGRNEKCHCGSNKKYKKCCYLRYQEAFNIIKEKAANDLGEDDGAELIQFFGYNTPRLEDESPFNLPEEGLCCMVSSVNKDIQREINRDLNYPLLKLGKGQWIITANEGDQVKFSGPYNSQELALDSAQEKFGAIRFMSAPNLI